MSTLYEARDGVGYITIDRPDRRNAISPEVVQGISNHLTEAESDPNTRVLVLTGAGDKAFCAGGDLGGGSLEGGKVSEHFRRSEVGALFEQMRKSRLPIVARVNGHALAGGFGLMLACDLVIASTEAEMGTPEVNIGLWPFMISAIIQRDVPRKVALEFMLTGRRFKSTEGERWGFVNRVVTADMLDKAVDEAVTSLREKSPLILALGKRSFYRAEDLAFDDALEYLSGMLTVCLESEDTVEGVTAFLQKRAPEWKGR
ncbi:MAG TPA: enoyl-CoA hydratase/isomerase family protein [Actinomycetota bacterium]|nr:enoyl-CoA hydratase/isomerase family protein [Actinomycetota bacterium]